MAKRKHALVEKYLAIVETQLTENSETSETYLNPADFMEVANHLAEQIKEEKLCETDYKKSKTSLKYHRKVLKLNKILEEEDLLFPDIHKINKKDPFYLYYSNREANWPSTINQKKPDFAIELLKDNGISLDVLDEF